jgi:hypothetical protein
VAVASLAFLAAPLMAQQPSAAGPARQTQIVLLGTGNPLPDPDRSGPATAVVVNGTPYLVDMGVGLVRRAKAAVIDKMESYGYRFDTPDRSIVISGDTAPTQATIDACRGCDVLIHEVNTLEWLARRPDFQSYSARYHTSTAQLAELATQARPRLLIIHHASMVLRPAVDPRRSSPGDLLGEISSRYSGPVVVGSGPGRLLIPRLRAGACSADEAIPEVEPDRGRHAVPAQAEPLHLLVERRGPDAQRRRRPPLMTAGRGQRADDQVALVLADLVLQIESDRKDLGRAHRARSRSGGPSGAASSPRIAM